MRAFLIILMATGLVFNTATQACSIDPARTVMDSLLNLDISQAEQRLQAWPVDRSNKLKHELYTALTTLVRSYNDGAGVNQHYKDKALKKLNKLITKTGRLLEEGETDSEIRFVYGMSEAYASAILLSREKKMRAYNHSFSGREALQELVNDHPEMEDAYLVLGMFEYFLGSIPEDMKGKARTMGMEGDRDIGLSYLERAVENAPISAPEAARVLLLETELPDADACRYKNLAAQMNSRYPANELFQVTSRIISLQCRIAEAEGEAVAEPVNLNLNKGCRP